MQEKCKSKQIPFHGVEVKGDFLRIHGLCRKERKIRPKREFTYMFTVEISGER